MTEEQPSMATGVTEEQPSMAAATAEEQPSMAAATAEEQPSMAAAKKQPTMSIPERTAAIFSLNWNLRKLLEGSLEPELLEYMQLLCPKQMKYQGNIDTIYIRIYDKNGIVKYYVSENKIYSKSVLTDTEEKSQSTPDTIKIGRMFQYSDGTIWKVWKKHKTNEFDIGPENLGPSFRTTKDKLETFAEFIDK